MRTRILATSALLVLAATLAGAAQNAPAPPNPAIVTLGGMTETLWPFVADDFSGAPDDPVNLLFLNVDPREIRQLLLGLDGNRAPVFPEEFPFNCTWSDAMGYEQAAWAESTGWVGGEVQLACGGFGPLRFHLRLFRAGALTLGGAHFEMVIPNTAQHQVLSWEFAEQFVKFDVVRAGAPTPESVVLTTPGTLQAIPHQLYNPMLGVPSMARLFARLGLPPMPQSAPLPIPTDGTATVLAPSVAFAPEQAELHSELTMVYNFAAPKPFCPTGPTDFVFLQGPLHLSMTVHTTPAGNYSRSYIVAGVLDVTPISPTGVPTGPTVQAIVSQDHRALLTDNYSEIREIELQSLLASPVQSYSHAFSAGHSDRFTSSVTCGAVQP